MTPIKSTVVEQSEIIVEVDAEKVDAVIDAEQRRIAAEKELLESKRLVEELKAQEIEKKAILQAAAEAAAAEKRELEGESEEMEVREEEVEETPEEPLELVKSGKRSIEEVDAEELPEEDELEEGRKIATNSRALVAPPPPGGAMQTFKQAAWGALVFGVGVGATLVFVSLFKSSVADLAPFFFFRPSFFIFNRLQRANVEQLSDFCFLFLVHGSLISSYHFASICFPVKQLDPSSVLLLKKNKTLETKGNRASSLCLVCSFCLFPIIGSLSESSPFSI